MAVLAVGRRGAPVREIGRLSLARLARLASTSELGRRNWRGRQGRRSIGGGGRREGSLDNEGGSRFGATTVLAEAVAWRRSDQRSVLGVEVDSERQSEVGEHPAAVAVKRRRKLKLRLGAEKMRPTRGAAPGRRLHARRVEAGWQVAHVGAAAGAVGTPRWRSTFQSDVGMTVGARAGEEAGWAGPVQAGVASSR
jgi:hypothetical protein